MEGAEFVHDPAHERGERPALGPADGDFDRIAGELV